MNNWGLWLWGFFSLITFFFPFSISECFIPSITVDKTVGCRDLADSVKERILLDKKTVARDRALQQMRLLICVAFFSALVLFSHFWIAGLENSAEERKDCRLLWWPPASSLSCSLCLPFFLSLCISMPWKFREAIVYQTEAWPIAAQRENVSSAICVISESMHSEFCCGKLATKQNILSVEMRKKRTQQLWGQKWTETHAEVHRGFMFAWMRALRRSETKFADSS